MDNGERDLAPPKLIFDPLCRNPGRQFLNVPRVLDRGIEYEAFDPAPRPDCRSIKLKIAEMRTIRYQSLDLDQFEVSIDQIPTILSFSRGRSSSLRKCRRSKRRT